MTSRLINLLSTTDRLAEVFSDAAVLQVLIDVEAALAEAEAEVGVIPREAAKAIRGAAVAEGLDVAALIADGRRSGTVVVPLVAALTARVRATSSDAAGYVHWGATSQDIVDTALVLLVRRAVAVIRVDHAALAVSLRALSDRHAGDIMIARTLLQPASPTTFGLKAAQWLAGVSRSWRRLDQAARDACVLQLGGAAGTLAALGTRGPAVADALGRVLDLPVPAAPWHTERDGPAALVAAAGVYTGVIGKMARDVSLLMQAEVAEVFEPGGGSSTLPQKRNPVGSAVAIAAATRLPGLVAAALAALVQEHERAVGAWQAELPIVADALQTTGSAVAAVREVTEGLTVDAERMRANLDELNGAVLAERVVMHAAGAVGRDRAYALVRAALDDARATGEPLVRAFARVPELAAVVRSEPGLVDDPASYLGVAEVLRRRLLDSIGVE